MHEHFCIRCRRKYPCNRTDKKGDAREQCSKVYKSVCQRCIDNIDKDLTVLPTPGYSHYGRNSKRK